jgi:hypothetical protein
VSENTNTSPTEVINTPNPQAADLASEGGSMPPNCPIDCGPAGQPIAGGSQMETSRDTIRRAQEAVDNIDTDTMKKWKSAVNAVQWVMDAVSTISEVNPVSSLLIRPDLTSDVQLHPCAKLAWSVLSKIPEVLLLVLS